MLNTLQLVREFQTKFECEMNDRPTFKTQLSLLRLNLLKSELDELKLAIATFNRVEILDALTDLQYVLDGAFLSLGYKKTPYPHGVVHGSAVAGLEQLLVMLTRSLMNRDYITTELTLDHLQLMLDYAYEQQGFTAVKDAAFAEVHRSNMTKLGADGKPVKNQMGKVVKGPNYEPPQLGRFVVSIKEGAVK